MYKISEIISSPVISLYESENQGIIYNVVFDLKTLKGKFFNLLNEKDNLEKVIEVNEIYKIGKNCLLIKNSSSIELKSNFDYLDCNCASIINLPIYNLNGELIGTSKDCTVDDKFNILKIILNNGDIIEKEKIINVGKSIILTNNTSINIHKFKPKLKISNTKKNNDKKVIILDTQKDETKAIKSNKIITDYRFLIGRTLDQDIISINGEILAKKGSIINNDMVKKASLYGKLVELARFSKKIK